MAEPKLKVVFAEGCFDNFDGTPEELAEFIAEIRQMAEDGTIMDGAVPMTEEQIAELEEIKREPRQ
jgi:DNA-binding GntR family transcriptional regulator